MSFVKGFNMFGTDAIQISCITGNGSPTTSTVGAVGMLYMDTSSSDGDLWKCIEVNNDVYKWVRLINEDLLNIPNVDWNQDDSTAKDYIKNRPFYRVYNLAHSTDNDLTINTTNAHGGSAAHLESTIYPTILDNYYYESTVEIPCKVIMDGKEYISTIKSSLFTLNTTGINTDPYIGNGYLMNDQLPSTGEDFCIYRCCVSAMSLYLKDNVSIPTSLSIYDGGEVCKISTEYLPDYTLGKHTDGLLYVFVNGSPVGNGITIPSSAVLYTNQELTEDEKTQARENIGLSENDIKNEVQSYVDEAILGGAW